MLTRKLFLDYIGNCGSKTDHSIYTYHEFAKKKRELKENIQKAHNNYLALRNSLAGFVKESVLVEQARLVWRDAVDEYNTFCAKCKNNNINFK